MSRNALTLPVQTTEAVLPHLNIKANSPKVSPSVKVRMT